MQPSEEEITLLRLYGILTVGGATSVRVGATIFQQAYDGIKAREHGSEICLRHSDPDIELPNLLVAGKPVILDSALPDYGVSWVGLT